MARRVVLTETGPVKLGPLDKPVSVCACGLSKTFPMCDGSHKTTAKLEEPGFVYEYDPVTLAVVSKQAGADLVPSTLPPAGSAAPGQPAT